MSRELKSNYQFFDVFSDSSSDSPADNPTKGITNELVSQKNMHSGCDSVEIQKSFDNLHLGPVFINSKLRFNEQQTDFEMLMPDGIESIKLSTGALNRLDSSTVIKKDLNTNNIQSQALVLNPKNSTTGLSVTTHHASNKTSNFKYPKNDFQTSNKQINFGETDSIKNLEKLPKAVCYSTPNLNQFTNDNSSIILNPMSQYYHPIQSYSNNFINNSLLMQPVNTINTHNNPYYTNYQSYYPSIQYNEPYTTNKAFPYYNSSNLVSSAAILVPTQVAINSYGTAYNTQSIGNLTSATSSSESLQLGYSNDEMKYLAYISQNCNFIRYLCSLDGCKDIQKRLHKMGKESSNYLVEIILGLNGLETVMTDSSANYIFQKAAELISTSTKKKVFKLLGPKLHIVGCDVFGSHSIQKLISLSTSDTEREILVDMISKVSSILCYDNYGVYVVMKAITKIPDSQRAKLNQALLEQLENLIKNVQGVCVVSD